MPPIAPNAPSPDPSPSLPGSGRAVPAGTAMGQASGPAPERPPGREGTAGDDAVQPASGPQPATAPGDLLVPPRWVWGMELLLVIVGVSPVYWLLTRGGGLAEGLQAALGGRWAAAGSILAYFFALFVVWSLFSAWLTARARRRIGARPGEILGQPDALVLLGRGALSAVLAAVGGALLYGALPSARILWLPLWLAVFAAHLAAVAATPLLAPAISRPSPAALERLGEVTAGLELPQDVLLTRRGKKPFFPFVKVTRLGSEGTGAPARYWGVGRTRTIFIGERFLHHPRSEVRAAIAMEAAKVRRRFNLNRIARLHLLFLPGVLLLALAPGEAFRQLGTEVDDLPLALALVAGIALGLLPWRQRRLREIIEEADEDALLMTRDPVAYARLVERYEGERETYPAPLRRWLSPKPTVAQRVKRARDWEGRHAVVSEGTWNVHERESR